MEDLEMPSSPTLDAATEPQHGADPGDPLRPELEEENNAAGTPPMADPEADMEIRDDDEHPLTDNVAGQEDKAHDAADEDADHTNVYNTTDAINDDDDDDSVLDEVNEEEFADFNPDTMELNTQREIDADTIGAIGVHKRKRTAEEEEEHQRKKKKKEKKREKPKRRRAGADEDDFEGGPEIDGKRSRKNKLDADGKPIKRAGKAPEPEVSEEHLSPEERRRRALDRKMDEALKSHRVSRRKAAQDAEERADHEIEAIRRQIIQACEADQKGREDNQIATAKIKILPKVVELMNRNTIQSQLVDPEVNILEAVRFMLEPADKDGALPNYQIQRELFAILSKLSLNKECLVSSGIGKVMLFYTKSTQAQPEIKRQAERLVAEWMRIVLNKGKDRRNLPVESRTYDPLAAAQSQRAAGSQKDRAAIAAENRRKALSQEGPTNRARVQGGVGTYTIAPVSNLSNAQGVSSRKLGASGEDQFRKIAGRAAVKSGQASRR
ncbi:hypothetical protein DOTSEDRAFT_69699 [Dothistroma septosporum NZE10]|uniref:TFIIS N-terminal domain-containing protein n=1 Tax=Dothistroma septosporum (strain NZE10 / CBS 128990) TaxID=675120 RepID=N1PZN6_DOTSN|nr:hypothetical protein DOTSEDRAFT_69699 [Dothistroma septosporum NZE10]